jgi:hypothetical protein
MTDYIEVYENALDNDFCAEIVERFQESSDIKPGHYGGNKLDKTKKDSMDITITGRPEWRPVVNRVNQITFRYLTEYIRKYAFILFGVMGKTVHDGQTGKTIVLDEKSLGELSDQALGSIVSKGYRPGMINIQKYAKGQGGYHSWHSEIAPADVQCEILHRVLFYIYFLNDVDTGGETAFFYQDKLVQPKRGRLLIAPCGFTHTHKGNIPISNDKYILTSWILFKRHETLTR